MDRKKVWESYRFPLILLAGIVIGAIIGLVFGEKATVLAPPGDTFINLMFTIVVLIVFIPITNAVGSMSNMKRLGKILGSLVITFIVTGPFAAVLVLVAVNIWPLAANTTITMGSGETEETASASSMVVNTLMVDDFSGLMSRKNMPPLTVFAIMSGIAVSACSSEGSPVGQLLCDPNKTIMKLVDMIMKLVPIGFGAYFANSAGEFGPQLTGDYGRTMLVYYPMCLVYAGTFFPAHVYFAGGKLGVKKMLKSISNPAITAFATQSFVATIPVNMEVYREIGVPEDISNIVLPVGAIMYMGGSVLSVTTKTVFLFGVFHIPYTGAGTYTMSIVVVILSVFVLSGASGGGLVGEMLIVSLFGFLGEVFPLIATTGFLVDPPTTCLSASGDTIASMMIARVVEGKDWLTKAPKKTTCDGDASKMADAEMAVVTKEQHLYNT